MADEHVTVRITLRKHVAERLKRMCYARGLTASDLIDSWVLALPEDGKLPSAKPRGLDENFFQQVIEEARKSRK